MDADFWHDKWSSDQIGFHQADINAALRAHFDDLAVLPEARIFVPLCGKTRDIGWLMDQGHHVVGVELSTLAIDQLFADLGIQPKISPVGDLRHYKGPQIDIFVGDVFDLTPDQIGPIHAIYDRAALVALPDDLRRRYAAHLIDITQRAPQLVLCFSYLQSEMTGPPFSINADMLAQLYSETYTLTQLSARTVDFKGTSAQDVAWHLT